MGEDGDVTPQDGEIWGGDEEINLGDPTSFPGMENVDLTPLQELSIEMHETYEAYLFAGFTSKQALWLSVIEGRAHIDVPGDDYFDLDE